MSHCIVCARQGRRPRRTTKANHSGVTLAAQPDMRSAHEPTGGSIFLFLLYDAMPVKTKARSERKRPMIMSAAPPAPSPVTSVYAFLKLAQLVENPEVGHALLK